jgi:hypothetical protein
VSLSGIGVSLVSPAFSNIVVAPRSMHLWILENSKIFFCPRSTFD